MASPSLPPLRILPVRQAPPEDIVLQCRNDSWQGLLLAGLIMLGIGLFLLFPSSGRFNPGFVVAPFFAAFIIFAAMLLRLRRCRGKQGWLLRVRQEGLYVNLRSFRNQHFPEDSHRVLFIPREQVAAVGKTIEHRYVPDRRMETKDRLAYLDIYLRQADLASVREALRDERRQPPARELMARRKHLDYPVQVHEPGVVRLAWDWVRPKEDAALARLGEHYPVLEDRTITRERWKKLDDAQQEAFIAELWETGHIIDAVRLVRMKHTLSERRARQYLRDRMGE